MNTDAVKNNDKGVSIVVPAFNSSVTLVELAARISGVMSALPNPFELVIVNDGGNPTTWDVIVKLASQHDWIKGISLTRNCGQQAALLCGIFRTQYDTIVTMDDDLQHPPEEIPGLVTRLHQGFDVVYGVPQVERHGLFRDSASRLVKYSLKYALGIQNAKNVSAFRCFKAHLKAAFVGYNGPLVSVDALLSWGTTTSGAVVVRHDLRKFGKSNYGFYKLVRHTVDLLTTFSTAPLRLASIIGFSFTGFGIIVLFYVIGRYVFQGSGVPGFPFLASIIAIFSGAQLLALGIVGEYLARMYFHVLGKPAYTVRETTDDCQ